jgi:hypothetical protein
VRFPDGVLIHAGIVRKSTAGGKKAFQQ